MQAKPTSRLKSGLKILFVQILYKIWHFVANLEKSETTLCNKVIGLQVKLHNNIMKILNQNKQAYQGNLWNWLEWQTMNGHLLISTHKLWKLLISLLVQSASHTHELVVQWICNHSMNDPHPRNILNQNKLPHHVMKQNSQHISKIKLKNSSDSRWVSIAEKSHK